MPSSHSAYGRSNPDACAAGDDGAEDADISSLLGMLASVTDPRSPQGIQRILEFVLAVCVVAMLGVHSRGELGLVSAGDPLWVWRAPICVAGAGVAVFARVR